MSERSADASVLDFSAFWELVRETLSLEPATVTTSSRLGDEVELDSLQMIELVLLMEDLGAELPEDLIPILDTIGDLHHHYVLRSTAQPPGRTS